jgi:DnaJ-domain-containing protein 1
MYEFEATVLADLAALKSQMAALLGQGQPGRLTALEDRLERHEVYLQRIKGFAGALFVLTTIIQVAIDYLWR